MNNDRFLTRVWDKQEKRMLYSGYYIGSIEYKYTGTVKHAEVIAVDGDRMWVKYQDSEGDCFREVGLGNNRFIPMQCWGLPDKNKKLIYEFDITRIVNTGEIAVIKCVRQLGDTKKPLVLSLCPAIQYPQSGREFHFGTDPNNLEIIGNRWENPELWEVKE